MTLRIRTKGEELLTANSKGKIVAGWHGRSFLAALRWANRGWYVLVSHSRDGEIMTKVFQKFGFKIVRGSTGKGGARAAVECARLLRDGEVLLFSPDGPQGPTHLVQQGILWLAQNGNAEILPTTAVARPRKLINSWDSYQVPMPFGKGLLILSDPISVPKGISEEEVEKKRVEIENAIDRVELEGEAEMDYL